MRCEEWSHLLDLSLDGELPEETARALDRHSLRCPACAYELRTLETDAPDAARRRSDAKRPPTRFRLRSRRPACATP